MMAVEEFHNDKCENYRQALLDLGINVDILDGKVE